jgi:hypothetical protein
MLHVETLPIVGSAWRNFSRSSTILP